MSTKGNDPAFANPGNVFGKDDIQPASSGLTKREFFAVMMMQALTSSPESIIAINEHTKNSPQSIAVKLADLLITELNMQHDPQL